MNKYKKLEELFVNVLHEFMFLDKYNNVVIHPITEKNILIVKELSKKLDVSDEYVYEFIENYLKEEKLYWFYINGSIGD